ncbi:MAG TPA: magnesium transporter [Solirubrobacter sp.]|nr:magnesium transporter [Solirubrobacter sp.]
MEREVPTTPVRHDRALPPYRLAAELEALGVVERATRFRLLDKDTAAAVFDALEPWQQRELLDGLRSPRVLELLEAMEPDDRVRLFDELPAAVARRLLTSLSGPERALTDLLLGYPPESAGRIMSPEYLELRPESTVAQALATVRACGRAVEMLLVLPVRDAQRRLAGVVQLTDLVLAEPDAAVADVVDGAYPAVGAREDQEHVARLMWRLDLVAVPVVDDERRLVGIVTFDDAMEVLEHEQSEDLARSAGVSEPLRVPYGAVSVLRLVRSRIVWLLFLVAAATLTVTVLGAFESTLERVVTLALFVPLLIGTGGNCGAQAATTMTRAIAVGDVRFADVVPSLLKEAKVGLLLGLVFALLGLPLVAAIWTIEIAVTVSLTLLAICAWATTIGALLPLLSSRLGIDPAVVSAPLVTTFVDATGLLIYFGIAQLLVL